MLSKLHVKSKEQLLGVMPWSADLPEEVKISKLKK